MTNQVLKRLSASRGFPHVSVYFPTYVGGNEVQQNPIRLKNAIRTASEQLKEVGFDEREIRSLLAELEERVEDSDFWNHQRRGLSVFVKNSQTEWIKLPTPPPEITVVADRYHIRPLIPVMQDTKRFHVLSATLDGATLYEANEHELAELKVEGLPNGIASLRGQIEFQGDTGFHVRDRGQQVGGSDQPKYHALGESADDYEEVLLEQYAKKIAKAVEHHLAQDTSPLLLAGQARLLGRLKQELNTEHLADETVQKDPASLTDDELRRATREIANGLELDADREGDLKRLKALLEGGDVAGSRKLQELFRASEEGRIQSIFLDPDTLVWGQYDEAQRSVETDSGPSAQNEDLLNRLAVRTLAQRGEVYSMPEELREDGGLVAGLYRYGAPRFNE